MDDEPHIVELVGYTLRREGFEVNTAADGQAALARLRAEEPDLVILDLMLPGLDGREVCRRIRGESAVPVIMLTARGHEVEPSGREPLRVAGLRLEPATREVLLEHLWGHDFEGTTRTVDMHVSRLREKI